MPLYEYECPDCGTVFELLRPVSRRDEAALCPCCGQSRATRQLSRFVARSGLDRDVMDYASNVASGSSRGTSCASCTATSCAGCR